MNYFMNTVLSKSIFILTYECGTLYDKMKTTRRLRDQLIYYLPGSMLEGSNYQQIVV